MYTVWICANELVIENGLMLLMLVISFENNNDALSSSKQLTKGSQCLIYVGILLDCTQTTMHTSTSHQAIKPINAPNI